MSRITGFDVPTLIDNYFLSLTYFKEPFEPAREPLRTHRPGWGRHAAWENEQYQQSPWERTTWIRYGKEKRPKRGVYWISYQRLAANDNEKLL